VTLGMTPTRSLACAPGTGTVRGGALRPGIRHLVTQHARGHDGVRRPHVRHADHPRCPTGRTVVLALRVVRGGGPPGAAAHEVAGDMTSESHTAWPVVS